MNPSINDNGSSNLPSPIGNDNQEDASIIPSPQDDGTNAVSQNTTNAANSISTPLAGVGPALTMMGSANNSGPTTSHSNDSPQIADDADLIEKEWVMKAKDIVNRTKDNPNEQSKEMNKFKADYLKKRYNKDLKISES